MQIFNFFLLLWVLKLLVYKPLLAFLDKRADSIQNNIKETEANKKEAQEILTEQKEVFVQARLEAKKIREHVEANSQQERELTLAKTEDAAKKIIENAKKEIDANLVEAQKVLLKKVGATSILLAEKILKKNLNTEENKNIIKTYLEEEK
ncbi:F0F1 ATP synthase subunit B [bacterium]|nr:F0F1 ATP synthase subunit B [bacterium]MBT3580839.1 F0F1 ATP synthase subunit B [bacterium]MBT4552405.1 F0F1 ATP synthase subunit B [bacterium]